MPKKKNSKQTTAGNQSRRESVSGEEHTCLEQRLAVAEKWITPESLRVVRFRGGAQPGLFNPWKPEAGQLFEAIVGPHGHADGCIHKIDATPAPEARMVGVIIEANDDGLALAEVSVSPGEQWPLRNGGPYYILIAGCRASAKNLVFECLRTRPNLDDLVVTREPEHVVPDSKQLN